MLLYRLFNPLFYHLRSRIKWRRPGYRVVKPGVDVDFSDRVYECWEELQRAYSIKHWADVMDRPLFMRNVLILDWLDQIHLLFPVYEPDMSWLDIGSKNFDYAYAFRAFQAKLGAERQALTGIELDGYRIYRDWHSRCDYGVYHAERTEANYVVGDVLTAPLQSSGTVSLLFPFVFVEPLLLWGLGPREYRPHDIYRRVWSLTQPGGSLLILSQGEVEAEASRALLAECQEIGRETDVFESGRMTCRIVEYPADVYYFVIRKRK